MNPHLDYYAILGIDQRASNAEIKRAFRERARRTHPDVNPDADAVERFKEINEAYRVLSDRRMRETYDARRLMLYGWGSGGIRGDRDPGVEEILRRWRAQPPPPRRRPPSGPFANRRNRRRRFQRDVSFWLMSLSLMCLLLAAAWALSYRAIESEEEPAEVVVVPATTSPTPVGVRPRRIDMWTISTAERLSYATLIYPESASAAGEPVSLALPLQATSWEILIFNDYYGARRVDVGGEEEFDGGLLSVIPDPLPDADQVPEAYGAELGLVGSSLLSEVDDRIQIEIPLNAGGDFDEWLLAVAVPPDSLGGPLDTSDLPETFVDDWRVIYFDPASASELDTFRLVFTLPAIEPGSGPDIYQVDALRP